MKIIKKYKSLPVTVRASFWFLICAFFQKGISVITTPIFTRLLTTAEYGEYSVFNSWLGIVTVFVSLNLYYGCYTSGLVRYEDDRENFVSSFYGINLTCELLWLLIYFIFRNFWNRLFSLTTVQMLCMFSLIWTTSIFNFWSAKQRVRFKYKALVIITMIMSLAKPLLGIALVLNSEDKVTARIFGLCIVELILCLPLFLEQLKKNHHLFNRDYWKYALTFAIPLIPHYLSQVVLNSSDRIMIKDMVGSSEAGIYNLAYSISMIMSLFCTALMQTLEPWMYIKLKKKEGRQIAPIAYSTIAFMAVINIILILVAPEIVTIFAPQTYYDAIWVIPPIAMSVFFLYQYSFFAVIEFYYKETKFISIATVSGALINVITNYIFIKIIGWEAAGYTTLLCFILYALFHYLMMEKLCRKNLHYYIYNKKTILLESLAFLIVGFALTLLYEHRIIRYVVVLAIAIIAFIKRNDLKSLLKQMMTIRNESKEK